MNRYWEDFEAELEVFKDELKWLIRMDGLHEDAESFYKRYLEQGGKLLEQTPDPKLLEEGKWDKEFNFRKGYQSIRGTLGEMFFESAMYLAGLTVEERVTDKLRQVYGEDFVVVAHKVSVKVRRHYPSVYENEPDSRITLYESDFKPALWRVDILALVDLDTRTVTTINYAKLAKLYCEIDDRQYCTPKFDGSISISLKELQKQTMQSVNTINVGVELKDRQNDKNNR